MIVFKSDKTYEEYSIEKVRKGIKNAYNACNEVYNEGTIDSLIKNLFIYEKISSKEIRRQVEEALMSINKGVAKQYISKCKERDEGEKELKKNKKFIEDYINASNASTGSKYDSNANVSNKNVVTMGQELYKLNNIRQNRYMMEEKLSTLFSKKLAKQYIQDLDSHLLYKHDETAIPGMPYCVSITMYPFLVNGLTNIGGVSVAPTDLKSYCGEFINLLYSVSSQFAGATSTPEWLLYLDYFIRKDYGNDYLTKLDTIVEYNRKERTLEKVIENCFQQCVHSCNMPAGNRGYQTVFWNIGYFDENYFKGVFDGFVFPDGDTPKWETLSWLQKKFMKWFNQERSKYVLTFPVETMAMLTDGEDIVDKEYADFSAEMWSEGHSFFCYLSDSADSLASCCFSKEQKVLTRSSCNSVNYMTFEELYNCKSSECNKNFKVFHDGSWVHGKVIKMPNRNMYKIITSNNKEIIVSDNHLNPTFYGDKKTEELTTNDYLLFNTKKLVSFPEKDEKLTYEQGYVIGSFLGDGSFGSGINEQIYDINFSQNISKFEKCQKIVTIANKQLGGDNSCLLNKVVDNLYPLRITSKNMVSFIIKWTNWYGGTYSHNKELNLDCLLQSHEFRNGILDGWYDTDGGNSNRCYTTSPKLAENMEVLLTSLGMNSTININDQTSEGCVIRDVKYDRNHPLYCVRWYDPKNKKNMGDVYKFQNNSMFFKIKSIEKIDNYKDDIYCFEMENQEEPYFTLPNGLITHNCRLRNSIKTDDEHNNTTHQFSMGTASVATGSKSVITINLNRLVQESIEKHFINNNIEFERGLKFNIKTAKDKDLIFNNIKETLQEVVFRVHKYHTAFNSIVKDFYNAKMLDIYSAGFIDLKKQFLTIGVNGLTDAAEFLCIDTNVNDDYKSFVNLILETINMCNKKSKTKELMYNCEFVPGENLSNKNYNWDKNEGFFVSEKHNMYSSYFYNPEDDTISILDKFVLHGNDFVKFLDGGVANHVNIAKHLSKEQYRQLLKIATKEGCNYFTYNIKNTVCEECGYIDKNTLTECPKCNSKKLSYLTRIIGYLKKVSSFNEQRQIEESNRVYH